MRKGQNLPLKQRIKIELPEGLLGQFGGETDGGVPRSRIIGAAVAGVGAYLLVRTAQKTAGDIVRSVVGGLTTVGDFLVGVFSRGVIRPSTPSFLPEEELLALDPFAVSVALITGGMILAGQNPGEILKGIGEIIPG